MGIVIRHLDSAAECMNHRIEEYAVSRQYENNRYNKLKTDLINNYTRTYKSDRHWYDTRWEIRKLVDQLQLGSKTPSQLWNEMKDAVINDNSHYDDAKTYERLKDIWLDRLPCDISYLKYSDIAKGRSASNVRTNLSGIGSHRLAAGKQYHNCMFIITLKYKHQLHIRYYLGMEGDIWKDSHLGSKPRCSFNHSHLKGVHARREVVAAVMRTRCMRDAR